MPPIHPFRLSMYASLAVAIISLGIAGADLLIDIPIAATVSLILLAFAYYCEGRWQLSLRDANFVGLCLSGLLGLWIIYRIVGPPTGLSEQVPLQAIFIPYFSPILMMLIPAKLFRPKHNGDFWTMHGMGLMAMALACAMAADGAFLFLFALYCALLIWGLSTFHLIREMGQENASVVPLAGGLWSGSKVAMRWSLALSVLALPLFWLTPRTGGMWELGINARGRLQTGLGENTVDLNRTGELNIDSERSVELTIVDENNEAVEDFPVDARFRVSHLVNYSNGRWVRPDLSSSLTSNLYDRAATPPRDPQNLNSTKLPSFGPKTKYITFRLLIPMRLGLPLADPVMWRTGDLVPIITNSDRGPLNWIHRYDSLFDPIFDVVRGNATYTQAWLEPEVPGGTPAMRMNPSTIEYYKRIPNNLSRMEKYTEDLLNSLLVRGVLPEAVRKARDPISNQIAPQHYELVGRAIEQHLAHSGEFVYSTELKRQDRKIDPAEDFLINIKAGHCQRFAGSLALMLRYLGIPTQVVLGYRGCYYMGNGVYEIHSDQAHAWVEILVPADTSTMPPFRQGFIPPKGSFVGARWLTLDPTPSLDPGEEAKSQSLFSSTRQKWEALTRNILIAYDAKARAAAMEQLQDWFEESGWIWLLGSILAIIGLWYLRRRWMQYRANRWNSASSALKQMFALAGQPLGSGQTVRELARKIALWLASDTRTAEHAQVPERIADAYYDERFGQHPPEESVRRELHESATRMTQAVRAAGLTLPETA